MLFVLELLLDARGGEVDEIWGRIGLGTTRQEYFGNATDSEVVVVPTQEPAAEHVGEVLLGMLDKLAMKTVWNFEYRAVGCPVRKHKNLFLKMPNKMPKTKP